jgi:DNA polymerase I-like protein with 3'-5' exonuclease and polymerase domains
MSILPVLIFMQTRGICVNKTALDETKIEVLHAAAERQKELDALCKRYINVNSPKDCQSYFYGELGIPVSRNAKGNPTLDDLVLQRLVRGTAARPGLRQAKLVQEIRGLQKLYGTYLNLEFDADGRIRCSYNPRGTKFGRLSSSKTIFGTGTNLQNLPQEFKKFLVPDEGYCFVEVDKRQAEWVVVAYCSGDANMIEAVESGKDIHVHTACEMFNVSPEIVKMDHKLVGHTTDADAIRELRHSSLALVQAMRDCGKTWPRSMSLRQCGKKSNHGLNYDEGVNGFALVNEIEIAESKRVITAYHKIYLGIRIWHESIKRQLNRDRILTNCFGRAVRFLGAWGDELWKSAYSMLPQSTVVDGLNHGMEAIYEDAEICGVTGANADVLAQVHDSILLQFPISYLRDKANFDWVLEKIKEYTSPEMSYSGRVFKIASDFKFGINWGGYDPKNNLGGMQEFDSHEDFIAALDKWENPSGERALELA